jgi:hypothetical protein
MINRIDFELEPPLRVGEERLLTAWATSPMSVDIECFRRPPLPPVLAPCSECGSFALRPGEAIRITASRAVFQDARGFLRIVVSDAEGDRRVIQVGVRDPGPGDGPGSESGPTFAGGPRLAETPIYAR